MQKMQILLLAATCSFMLTGSFVLSYTGLGQCREQSKQPQQYLWRLMSDVVREGEGSTDSTGLIDAMRSIGNIVGQVRLACHSPELGNVCLNDTIVENCGRFNILGTKMEYKQCQFRIQVAPRLFVQLKFHYFHLETIALALRATVFNTTNTICTWFNHIKVTAFPSIPDNIVEQVARTSLFYYCGHLPPFVLTLNADNALLDVHILYPSLITHVIFSHQVQWPPTPSVIRSPQEIFMTWDAWNFISKPGLNLCYTCIATTCNGDKVWSHFSFISIPFHNVDLTFSASKGALYECVNIYDGPTQQSVHFETWSNESTLQFTSTSHQVLLSIDIWKADSLHLTINYSSIERPTDVYLANNIKPIDHIIKTNIYKEKNRILGSTVVSIDEDSSIYVTLDERSRDRDAVGGI